MTDEESGQMIIQTALDLIFIEFHKKERTPMKKYYFDKQSWIQEKRLSDRKIIFLDNFVWCEFAKCQKQEFIDLAMILEKSVCDKKILVAVNNTLVNEIAERDIGIRLRISLDYLTNYLMVFT